MESNKTTKSNIKEASGDVSQEQGLNTTSQSSDAFSIVDEFGGDYNSSREKLALYLESHVFSFDENKLTGQSGLPKSVILDKAVEINNSLHPKLDLATIIELYQSIVVEGKSYTKLNPDKPDEAIKEILDVWQKNKAEATYLLALYIVKKYSIITVGEKEREMYIYRDGMYYPGAENLVIFPEIQKILGSWVTKSAKSETYHKIADATSYPRDIFTDASVNLIPLKNGVYDLDNNILLPHSPSYHFMYQFPVTYNPNATCPLTQDFMSQILTPEQSTIVEEWMGYCFYRNYMFKKAIIFVGAGDTGKTTLLEVITNLIGSQNISSVSLHKMTGDKFSAAHLYNKHGNLVDELSARDVTDTGAFKMATGGGTVTGEYKFGNQFAFRNFSKFTFACNQIPDVKDTNDEAYFNRWMVVRFENTIKKKIPNFVERLKTEEERSGLFNLAMEALRRLLKQQRFSYFNDAEDTKNEMMRSGSSLAMFASDMLVCEFSTEAVLTRDEMYDAYVAYCQKNKLSPQTKEMLGRRLTDYTNYISDGTTDIPQAIGKSKKVRIWRNVKLRVTEEKKVEVDKVEKEFKDF